MDPHLQSLIQRVERLERNPTQIRSGLNTRIDRYQNQYVIHADVPEGGGGTPPVLPWTFSQGTVPNPEDPDLLIPALILTPNSALLDYAGQSGERTWSPGFTIPLPADNYTTGEYRISLRLNYDTSNPMLPEARAEWLDQNGNGAPAEIQVTAGTDIPSPSITGEDPNAKIEEHSILLGTLIISGADPWDITSIRPGRPIELWPASISGLPTSHPL